MKKDNAMKINRLDAHDRLSHVMNQKDYISEECQKIVDSRPFGDRAFYIFAFKKEIGADEQYAIWASNTSLELDKVPTARIIWQPRLTKPKAQENSMLFKGYPGSDMVKVVWIIPQRELWDQYKVGNLTQHTTVLESIDDFINDRGKLEAKEADDPGEEEAKKIYQEISNEAKFKKRQELSNARSK